MSNHKSHKSDQHVDQAKQQFTKAMDNAHKTLNDLKSRWESEMNTMQPQAIEMLNSMINDFHHASTDL